MLDIHMNNDMDINTHMDINTSRPLYDGGSGVCVYFVCVYIFSDLLVSFACLWSSFCFPQGDFGDLIIW